MIFGPFTDVSIFIYLDAILVFSRTWKDHVIHVGKVFALLKREKLYLKMSKCEFGKNSLVYLGYMGGQLKIDSSKVEVIVNWPKSRTDIEVRRFLGEV